MCTSGEAVLIGRDKICFREVLRNFSSVSRLDLDGAIPILEGHTAAREYIYLEHMHRRLRIDSILIVKTHRHHHTIKSILYQYYE